MLRKIQAIDNQLKPTEAQIKAKVKSKAKLVRLKLSLVKEIWAVMCSFFVHVWKSDFVYFQSCLVVVIHENLTGIVITN